MPKIYRSVLALLLPVVFLWACSHNDEILKGDRLPVLKASALLEKDESLGNEPIEISSPISVLDWTQGAQNASHVIPNAKLSDVVMISWKKDIGTGSHRNRKLLSTPIASGGKVFTVDSYGKVTAFNSENGDVLWHFNSKPPKEEAPIANGGLASDQHKIYVSTGFAQVIALDSEKGTEIWRQEVSAPIRSAPSVSNGRVFVVTIDNSLFALSQKNGEILWQYSGMTEYAGLLGGASPAVLNDLVVAPFSSGEVFGIKVESGRPLWSEALTSLRRTDSVSAISTIKGDPVIDRDMVFVIGHGNRMFGLDSKTGEQKWEKSIGGLSTPLLHNDFIFVLSTDNQLLCLQRETGSIHWVEQLEKTLPKSKKLLSFSGPVLANGKLYLTNSAGNLVSFDPKTGKFIDSIHFRDEFQLPPIVADNRLYVLSESGKLYALK